MYIAPHIAEALANKQPVVALESTLISHGLPFPQNLEVAHGLEDEVRASGALPATIGVVGGVPTIGMNAAKVERFARSSSVLKLSRRDVAAAIAAGRDGATTVAATMALAAAAGIAVFATGGIGGVHRGAQQSWDVSADLTELARTPVLVVCAGAKAILDLPATLEQLETLGVPVVGLGTDEFPAFYSRSSGLPLPTRAEAPAEVAGIWRAQRQHAALCAPGGLLLCVPPPPEVALDRVEVETHIAQALARAEAAGVRGPAVTPFLLAAMAEATAGESIATNVALLRQNARVAAGVAVELWQIAD
ncbi:MAG: pseudouridine-5'-phosphate glycosidase [Chloroflexaceae bacterium]|jgi:pseudouridine-5'-phosphate glycosidase|nr:pseudouridine-5'-phosphate glycosidase [Chloroflexaceae bacterium]